MWQAQRTPWALMTAARAAASTRAPTAAPIGRRSRAIRASPRGSLGRIGVAVAASNPQRRLRDRAGEARRRLPLRRRRRTWKRVNSNWSLRQRAFYYMSDLRRSRRTPNASTRPKSMRSGCRRPTAGRSGSCITSRTATITSCGSTRIDPKLLLEGNDGGATVSTDGGKTWSTDHNQPTGQFYHVALDDQFPFHIYGAQQDEGSFEGPAPRPDGAIPIGDWHAVAPSARALSSRRSPTIRNVTYGSGYLQHLPAATTWPPVRRRRQPLAATTWTAPPRRRQKYRFGWTHPVFFSPADPEGTADRLAGRLLRATTTADLEGHQPRPDAQRPRDRAPERRSGRSRPDRCRDRSRTSRRWRSRRSTSNVIWAGSADGLVHVTRDDGADLAGGHAAAAAAVGRDQLHRALAYRRRAPPISRPRDTCGTTSIRTSTRRRITAALDGDDDGIAGR